MSKTKSNKIKEELKQKKLDDYLKIQNLLKESNARILSEKVNKVKPKYVVLPTSLAQKHKSKNKTKKKRLPKSRKFNVIQKSSKGELTISKVLKKYSITNYKEHIFKDCINPKTNCELRFDFYLPQRNLCIEFDGIQHFEYTPEFHSEDPEKGKFKLRAQQYRDSVKNEYCLNKDINLLRIKYYDFDKIEKIIIEYLNIPYENDIDRKANKESKRKNSTFKNSTRI